MKEEILDKNTEKTEEVTNSSPRRNCDRFETIEEANRAYDEEMERVAPSRRPDWDVWLFEPAEESESEEAK